MFPRRVTVALAFLVTLSLSWTAPAVAQRVRAKPAAANKQRAKQRTERTLRRPTARPKTRVKTRTTIRGKLRGIFTRRAERRAAAKQARALRRKAGSDARAQRNKAKADAKAMRRKASADAKAMRRKARADAKRLRAQHKAEAKARRATQNKQAREARNARRERKMQRAAATTDPAVDTTPDKDTGEPKRIIPERRKPIHHKLREPNFFDEIPDSKNTNTSSQNLTAESWAGANEALDRLHREPSQWFFSGDVGRVMAARLVSRSGRNDADFRYTYGTKSFKNFAKADKILNDIPRGKFANKLSVNLIAEVNKTAFAEGGDGLLTRFGKTLRKVFLWRADTRMGRLRNYQSLHFASKGLSATELANLKAHGNRFFKLPFSRAGWIVYARPAKLHQQLEQLVADTRAGLADPKSDPIKLSARFVQKFISLHPFPDGNGRTARLVMDRILAERGILPPILADVGNDIGMTESGYTAEILEGVSRTAKVLGVTPGSGSGPHVGDGRARGAANFTERMMSQHGHTISGIASKKAVWSDGLPYALGKDGFVYDVAGRPYLADNKGDLRPLSQMTHYIMVRRIALRTDGSDVLHKVTNRTRASFQKLLSKRPGVAKPKILSDVPAIKSDGKLAVNVKGLDKNQLLGVLDPSKVSSKNLFAADDGRSPLTTIMSRYQQADLELWYVEKALVAEHDTRSVAKIEKHRDRLFLRARAELQKRVKKGNAGDDNPLGAGNEFERLQYEYSPLHYATRARYVAKHGDNEAVIFRGENFAKWTGVHIDGVPFRPGFKKAAAMRAKRLGALNMYDDLRAVEGDTVGTGIQSYTSDLALLAQSGGFADKHKKLPVSLDAMPKWAQTLVGLRIKDGETIEVTAHTGLASALLSRRVVTSKGHLSIRDMDAKQLDAAVDNAMTGENAEKLKKRIAEVRAKTKSRNPIKRLGNWLRGANRFQVRADDLMTENELASLNTSLARSRNLLTVTRNGDKLDVTAHRRAIAFKVKKSDMLPGVDSIGGGFVREQEVHVTNNVLPNRIIDTYSQQQLATELGTKEAPAQAGEIESPGPAPIVKPLPPDQAKATTNGSGQAAATNVSGSAPTVATATTGGSAGQ